MNKSMFGLTEIKAGGNDSEMTFSGYGSVFGNVDSYGDIIEAGAFAKTIADFKARGVWPAMLSQHGGWGMSSQDMTPVGVWTEMREDEHGLYVEGKLADTERGRELYTLMKMTPRPAINGMSIGYFVTDSKEGLKDGEPVRKITGIELVELSLVTFPANGEARVQNVKQADELTIRDAETALRDAGFSRSRAKEILSVGFKSSSLRDAGVEGSEMSDLAAIVRRNIKSLQGKGI